MSEVEKSEWDVSSNPVLGYADSYRSMARQGVKDVQVWSVITDLERNIAPLFSAAKSELSALREELAETRRDGIAAMERLETSKARNAILTDALECLLVGSGSSPAANRRYAKARAALAQPTESGASE